MSGRFRIQSRVCAIGAIAMTLTLLGSLPASARGTRGTDRRTEAVPAIPNASPVSLDQSSRNLGEYRLRASAAAAETTVLGSWSFDEGQCIDEGWASVDLSGHGVFFHVDDFAGLGGGTFGRLVAPEGDQAMWCGLRANPADPNVCGYATLPGYGNNWDQNFGTVNCLPVFGDVVWDFILAWDSEPGYDAACMQFDNCDDNWVGINLTSSYYGNCQVDGWGLDRFSLVVPDTAHSGSVRLRFNFTSDGGWSDEDGLWDTDGAVIVDSVTVSDATGTVLPTELFESEAVGDQVTLSGAWEASTAASFGDYAALYHGFDMLEQDPCVDNVTCVWAFLNGTTADYTCGGYPGVPAIPYGNADGKYINNEIWSPLFPNAGTGSTFELEFDVYRDLPFDDLVFFVWHVRSVVSGCPGQWKDTGFVFYSPDKDWSRQRFDVSALVDASATSYQVALGVIDMCPVWCGVLGSGNCHSNSPMFDNPLMRRINTNGPTWSVRDIDRFQDSFPSDGTATGTVRADAAFDVNYSWQPGIHPGDSLTVTVRDAEQPLDTDPYTNDGPAVYAYVGVWPQGQASKSGAALTDDASRWPVVDSLMHNGAKWYCVRMDTAYSSGSSPIQDRFCVDLDDDLFTPGDTICYVFAAHSSGTFGSFSSYYSAETGRTGDLAYALDNPMEFTCLPSSPGRRILYVDNFDGRGAQPFFDTAFDQLGIADIVDRYDVLSPASFVSNGPASRVTDVFQQILPYYHTIIWNSGDLSLHSISDGGSNGPKQDDFALLYNFIDNLATAGGLYLSGDNLADNWDNPQTQGAANTLRSQYMNFNVPNGDHVNYGLGVSPLVIGMLNGCFSHLTGVDSLIAYGGCPAVTSFDVLQATGNSFAEAAYVGGGTAGAAILSQASTNLEGMPVGVVLSGFSFHRIRDIRATGVSARAEHLKDILVCLGSISPTPTGASPTAYRNSLSQNYPNPFNPTTTVEFTVKKNTRVQLRVYNVAGQLVRTLVDDMRAPGIVHHVEWDGRNAAGAPVASGVYFYRLSMEDFTQTRKMVLLK